MDERERLVAQILDLHRDFARQLHRRMPQEWLAAGLTMPQLKTLLVLYGMEKASMGELAEALGTGVSTVTGIVDRLVEQGLVVREEDPTDRRVVVGRPTAAGITMVDRLLLAARDRLGQILSQLTVEELRVVAQGSRILCNAATTAFASPAPPNVTARAR